MSMTEHKVLLAPVTLRELGIPGGSAGAVPASLVAVYYKRIGGYTERSTFVADVQIWEAEEALWFQSPKWAEWSSVFPDELPKSQVMVTLDPCNPRLRRGYPKGFKYFAPVAVYVLL